jgi:hypothetical protein
VSKIERDNLVVYGHFSQPPRGNPLTGVTGYEPEAAPFENWNHRILQFSYRPNVEADNFRGLSYSFGESLLAWMARRAPDVYEAVVAADKGRGHTDETTGNALATSYHHNILPLARRRDKRTQILWGIAAFEHRFGRKPLGFWLPEMAVDAETLSVLAEAGIRYTLLAGQQVRNVPINGGAGPYRVSLPRGQEIALFVRNDRLSSDLSFNIHNLGGAGHWVHTVLGPARKTSGPLTLLATEGETFGHHYAGEEQFLHWLLMREAPAVGYAITTLDDYFVANPPTQHIEVVEPSSWSDEPGLTSWATGHVDYRGDTTWRGALRRSLDNVASEIDRSYEDFARQNGFDAWVLRDQLAPVLVGEMSGEDFCAQFAPNVKDTASLKHLLAAQELIQRSYNSYTFTGKTLDSREPRYAIACAAAALATAQLATDIPLAERFVSDMAVVTANGGTIKGTDILRSVITEFEIALGV